MNDAYWAMLGGASATISGFAFISTTIFYTKLYSMARYANKKGLEGNITRRFIVKVTQSFVLLFSPFIISSITLIAKLDTIIVGKSIYILYSSGIFLLISGIIHMFYLYFDYDTNIAHFKCGQKYLSNILSSNKQLEDSVKEICCYFEMLKDWLAKFSQEIGDDYKVIYGTNKDYYNGIIYGSNDDAISKRFEMIKKIISGIAVNSKLTYKKIIGLTDMYEDLVTDVDKTKGQLRTIIRGLGKKNDEWKIFFQGRLLQDKLQSLFDEDDEKCK